MRKHASANELIQTLGSMDSIVRERAGLEWRGAIEMGALHGWRNAQASVLAPTGTIGFMMDCDTTGIEPDFSLVKFKKLVGGSSMQIVNQAIPRSLKQLGYSGETIEAIVEHVATHGHVVDAPGLREEHYEIFDTAMGKRPIAPMGHVRMMSAVQPFLSGAISKTVNLPADATVEDVEDVYFQGWKLGLKAVAVYRDNCKVGQPLSSGKNEPAAVPVEPVVVRNAPVRRRLPKSRPSVTTSFEVAGAKGYLTVGSYPDDGPGEIFLRLGKQGSTLAGVMDAFSIAVSIGLQYGVPLSTYVEKFTNLRFEPAGLTDDKDIRMAQSIMDYIFRRLALDHLDYETRTALGISTAAERTARLDAEEYAQEQFAAVKASDGAQGIPAAAESAGAVHSSAQLLESLQGLVADAPLCLSCGVKMRPSGSCYVCESCGSTSGCS